MVKRYVKKSKKSRSRRRTKMVLSSSPTPKQQVVRLKYDEYFELDPGAIAVADKRVWRANSVFDPDFSTTGFQPYGFDQWSAFYQKYTVIGSKIKCTFTNSGDQEATQIWPQTCFISLLNQSTGLSDVRQYTMSTKCVNRVLQGDDSAKVVLTMNCNPNKFLGVSAPVGEDSVTALTTATPTRECFFHTGCAPVNGTANAGLLRCYVELEYIVVFTEPRLLPMS